MNKIGIPDFRIYDKNGYEMDANHYWNTLQLKPMEQEMNDAKMKKKELIEDFLDNRSFRIPVEDLDVARNHLGLLIDSVVQAEKEKFLKDAIKATFTIMELEDKIKAEREKCAVLADDLIFDDMEEQYGGVPVNNIVFSIQARIAKAIRED